jgi:glucose-1-phosphate thymidylyltransferase
MQAPSATDLSVAQAAAADAGAKAMIPIGRPFLDYALSSYADAGIREVCIIVGPSHDEMRNYYEAAPLRRLRVTFSVQEKPIGVANAMLAARAFVGNDNFLVVNGDNYYQASVVRAVRAATAPALAAFSRHGLLADGQIPADRIAAYALLDIGEDGALRRIVEKPTAPEMAAMPGAPVSMTCWHFTPAIFDVCTRVPKSSRGELELPSAVQMAIDEGMRFQALPVDSPVWDLSSRADIPAVAARLAGARVEL